MLIHLTVKDFTLVDYLELEFEAGMSVISGETGAGKSIILNALGLALGDRADTSLIANGADKAEINATFDIRGNEEARQWLRDRDLADAECNDCIMRRVVGGDGRSRGFINGTPTTVGNMQALGNMLIDIHSQHEHQSLLKKETQRRLLDEFGDHMDLARKVSELYDDYKSTSDRLKTLIDDSEEQSSRRQLLEYQASELEELGIQPGEYEHLESEQKRLANAETILGNCHQAIQMCTEDENANALDQISAAIQLLRHIDDDTTRAIVDMLESGRIQIEEAVRDLEKYRDEFEADPARLEEVETRLGRIYEMARKHRVDASEIPAVAQRINDELAGLDNVEHDIDSLQTKTDRLRKAWEEAAKNLGRARKDAATVMEQKVSARLGELGMAGASLRVELARLTGDEPSPRGREDIEFLISTNPGQEHRPLARIASGGELSRISLAIQVVTADTSRVPTLVFDEVDVGIGGAVAEVVGALLRQLGAKAQIVCVTHLPQVAAQGHWHYRVIKSSEAEHATTRIARLGDEEKVSEIARMLGGLEMTAQSVAHAQEMFKKAQSR